MRSSALKAVGSRSVWLLVIAVFLAAAPRAGANRCSGRSSGCRTTSRRSDGRTATGN